VDQGKDFYFHISSSREEEEQHHLKPHFSISFNLPKFFNACAKLLDPLDIDIIGNKNHSLNPSLLLLAEIHHPDFQIKLIMLTHGCMYGGTLDASL
jgi:hypothetical protein